MSDTIAVKRVFRYNGTDLPDPSPSIPADQVKGIFASSGYPELQNAIITGPSYEQGKEVYHCKVINGSKG